MLNSLRAKLNNPFVREVLLAVVLFCLPFLLWVHVLFKDDSYSVIAFLGIVYNHEYPADQAFVWVVLSHLLAITYLLLFYYHDRGYCKHFVPFLLFLLIRFLISDLISGFNYLSENETFLFSIIFTSGLFLFLWHVDFLIFPKKSLIKQYLSNKKEILYSFLLLGNVILFFLLLFVPSINETPINFGLFKIYAFGFPTVFLFLWFISLKLVILTPLSIWFLKEKKWWKYALISPILITVYQIRTVFVSKTEVLDEYEIFQAFPLLGLVLIVLLALSKNAQEQYLFQAIYQKTYARFELKQLVKQQKRQEEIEQSKAKLEALKMEPNNKDMEELLELKRQLEEKLTDKQ